MISQDTKLKRIKTLQYIVTSRWFMHAGIVVLGLIQKAIGVARFDLKIFLLLAVSYGYNSIFYFYLRKDPKQLSERALHITSILQVVLDQLLVTIMLYATGGVESLSFLFYFTSIFMAIILLTEIETILLTLFTVSLYVGVIALEYYGAIPHIWRYGYDPGFFRNFSVTLHNTSTVVLIFIFTAFFASFISNIIRSREQEVIAERDKVITLINSLMDGIILLDPVGKVLIINPYAHKILQLNTKYQFTNFLHLHYFERSLHPVILYINQALTKKRTQTEDIIITPATGNRTVLQVTVIPIHDVSRRKLGCLVVLHDITRERDLDEVKSDFISVAAHQLRTPLSTLKWLFKLLLDGDGGPLQNKQKDLLKKGYERNNEVIEIVNNLLDISEIEEGKFMYQFIDRSLVELVQQVLDSCNITAQRKQIKLNYTPPTELPLLAIDPQKMKLAIQNLIENAVKYSAAGSTVTINLINKKKEVVLSIKDMGIGMSPETQEKIFVKFYRGKEATSLEPTGSGLGLYIVHNIIEKHHGYIDFVSALGKGSAFNIHLPVTKLKK
ncbi:MAG: ATP-binding protein [Patescibacteria group bacterium]|jgi:signal transduction histidine kinase